MLTFKQKIMGPSAVSHASSASGVSSKPYTPRQRNKYTSHMHENKVSRRFITLVDENEKGSVPYHPKVPKKSKEGVSRHTVNTTILPNSKPK